MPTNEDPYDRKAVLDKLAQHAWDHKTPDGDLKHRQDFIDRGIKSQAELRQAVDKGIDSKDTLAFSTRPDPQKSQTQSREFYEMTLKDKNNEPFKMIAVVNPGLDKRGNLSGGTCYVPDDPKQMKKELDIESSRSHNKAANWEPQLVVGGRPALREQETQKPSQEQKAPEKAQEPEKLTFKRDTPKEQEKPSQQQNQAAAPDKQLQFKRDTPREQEKGPSPDKAKSEQKAQQSEQLSFKRDDPTKTQGKGR